MSRKTVSYTFDTLPPLTEKQRRDLEALQSSGLENIRYPGFLVQVSSGHVRPDRG